jgi:hypothetical protein
MWPRLRLAWKGQPHSRRQAEVQRASLTSDTETFTGSPRIAEIPGSRPHGYAERSEGNREAENELAHYALAALNELRTASASLR